MTRNKVKKIILSSVVILSTSLSTIASNAFASSIENKNEAIQYLNQVRTELGISPLERNNLLDQSAQGHSDYLSASNEFTGHLQNDPNNPTFTGKFLIDRVEGEGFYGTGVGEGIAPIRVNSKQAVEDLIDAPYHRINTINPGHRLVGIGSNPNGFTVLNYGSLENTYSEAQLIKYPYDNQTNIKPIWFNNEDPNPLAAFGIPKYEYVGYPIMLSAFGMEISGLIYNSHTLVEEGSNTPVDSYVVHASNDIYSKKHIIIIPKKPLKNNTTYTVTVNATVQKLDQPNEEIREQWSFKTINQHELEKIELKDSRNVTVYFKTGQLDNYSIKIVEIDSNTLVYSNKVINGKSFSYNPYNLTEGEYRFLIESQYLDESITGFFEIVKVNGEYKIVLDNISTPPNEEPTVPEEDPQDNQEPSPEEPTPTPENPDDSNDQQQDDEQQDEDIEEPSNPAPNEDEEEPDFSVPNPDDYRKQQISQLISSKLELTANFTDTIDPNSLNNSTIFMLDSNGNIHDINYDLTSNKKGIKFSSQNGYESGVTYSLYITNGIKTVKGTPLRQPIMITFTGK